MKLVAGVAEPDQRDYVDCAVIIVTYNSARHIVPLLDCLPAAAAGLTLRVIVIDNGSSDDTVKLVRAHPGATCIETHANLGYAGGINVGRMHSGDCGALAVLNPDLILAPGSLRAMFTALDDPGIGAAVPMLLNDRGLLSPTLRREPTLARELGNALFGEHFDRRPGWMSETVFDEREYGYRHSVDWAGGAVMLISAACDRLVGAWDERFFLYMEEVDYAARVRAAGLRVEYVPQARAWHAGGGSSNAPALTALSAISRIRYFEKQGRSSGLLRAVVLLGHLLRSADPTHRAALRTISRRSAWQPLIAALKAGTVPSMRQGRSWKIRAKHAPTLLGAGVLGVACAAWQLSLGAPPHIRHSVTKVVLIPPGVTLQQIAGGPHYYASISRGSAWMDQHILIGAWLELPTTATDVRYDVAMGNNIYWNLAYSPAGTKECSALPCRVNFDVIRAEGMHASAPDVTAQSGSETVAYQGSDEADIDYGPGFSGWNRQGPATPASCIPSGSRCGYTAARFYDTEMPASDGTPGYSIGKRAITQGYGKGLLFWETNAQAEQFLRYSDTLSADSYWMTDSDLSVPSQGGCALLPFRSKECGQSGGTGLSPAQRMLTANYAFNVTRIQYLESLIGMSKPITVDVETGCPFQDTDSCATPAASVSAAWHALIAGARGIIWFQHNFGGPCLDDTTFYSGSDPENPLYNCQQTPGVTLHDMVEAISAFNHEVASLNGVLLSPFANNYVSAGEADVSVMAKYDKGTFYVFAASGKAAQPPSDNQPVVFRVAGHYTGPVTVVGEHRTLHADNGVFSDVFASADSVHVYKIGK